MKHNTLKKKIADGVRWWAAGPASPTPSRPRSMPRRAGTASPSTCSTARPPSTTWCRCCRPSAPSDATPLVRVPWNDPSYIMRALDAGAMGLICPMINTKAEAEAYVRAGRYPPMGERSFGPFRAAQYAGADYWQHANEEVLLFAMIETRQAVSNLHEILSVKGLNGVYIGPSDLSLSMGKPPTLDPSDKTVLEAMGIILQGDARARPDRRRAHRRPQDGASAASRKASTCAPSSTTCACWPMPRPPPCARCAARLPAAKSKTY